MHDIGEPTNDTLPHASGHCTCRLDALGLAVFMVLKLRHSVRGGTTSAFQICLSTQLCMPSLQGEGGPRELTLLALPEIGGGGLDLS